MIIKKSLFLIVILILFVATTVGINADLIYYPTTTFWNHTTGDGRRYLSVNVDNLNIPGWASQITTVCNNWNNYSNNIVYAEQVNIAYSMNDFCTKANWPAEWGANGVALTSNKDSEGFWWNEGQFLNYTYNIDYSIIYCNSYYTMYNTTFIRIRKSMTHELGHALQFGHPVDSSVQAVMCEGVLTWSNYDRPQFHDRLDLYNRYGE